ncbi:glycoside hydrolase family 28 protein [Hymenobacter sp. BT186]|uniref:Glycoside hydrolase family 28 protein n=1 Tax=Hymenobacter telluris TaxID=2816474 RepID=A0A939JBC6_9BACT|nr:glycoside hydrolase family 28 protein [Hymenobacter telluris]MBO0356653.1 glycoside hydrolase family 28 protein [Hymenobacter telluris]MBW3372678.1 glycoside hydrolase family 28 protein [Hymenobacter norwichensis]
MKVLMFFLGIFLLLSTATQAQQYYNVLKYGARNDSTKLSTEAIKKAIAAASKAGGGTVYFPAGKYRTGAIHLKSNITIDIDAGAILYFSDNFDDYLPMVPSRYEGIDITSFSPLFYAYKAENITIKGRGIIDGQGKKWWDFAEGKSRASQDSKWQQEFFRLNKDIIKPDEPGVIERGFMRPPFIQPMYCKNVRIEGITIRNSPFWTVNPEFCENVTVMGVTINNPKSPNTDGINPESCRNVHISNCHISVGDDCITIKSGKDRAGRQMNVPAENYTITNCTMLSGHGGVVIGSEMSGGVKKITISNCIFDGTDRGIRIKTARGRGGVVEDIRVDNVVMKNIREQVIVLDMQYAKSKEEPVSERTPRFRNIHFSNITAEGNQAGYLNGLAEMPIENVTFSNLNIDAKQGFTVKEARNIAFHNVQVNPQIGPAVRAENVQQLRLDGLRSTMPTATTPLVELTNTEDAFIYNTFPAAGTENFLKLKGAKTRNIVLQNNNFKYVKAPVSQEAEVKEKVIVN